MLYTFDQTLHSARAYNLSLKYLRCTPSGSIDIGDGNFEFIAKTQILSVQVACGDHLVLIRQTDDICFS